jgi:hypothetical protein
MVRTMLNDSKISDIFWGQVVHTTVHLLNRGLIKSNSDKTPYELWKEYRPMSSTLECLEASVT